MWPGFKSRRRRHMWIEFVVGSILYCERFFSGYSGFPLSSKNNISKFQFDQESGRRITTLWVRYLQVIIYLPWTLCQREGLLNVRESVLSMSLVLKSADTCLYSYHLPHISRAPFLVCHSQFQEFASWNSIYFPPGSVASKSLHPPLGWEKEMNPSSFDVCHLPGLCYQQLSKRIRKNETDQSYTWHDIVDYGKMFCLNLGYPFVLKDFFFQYSAAVIFWAWAICDDPPQCMTIHASFKRCNILNKIYTKAAKNISISMDRSKKWLVPYIVIVSVTFIIHHLNINSKLTKKKTDK